MTYDSKLLLIITKNYNIFFTKTFVDARKPPVKIDIGLSLGLMSLMMRLIMVSGAE